MNTNKTEQNEIVSVWLRNTVADCLKVEANQIEHDVPLVRYGLDSLGAVQLTMAVGSKLQCKVPETLLLACPDLDSLAAFIQTTRNSGKPPVMNDARPSTELKEMLQDSRLPADICPQVEKNGDQRDYSTVLLTGATGFLGAYMLRALMRNTSLDVKCLVRSADANMGSRVRQNLESYGLWEPSFENRVSEFPGDLQRSGLGLSAAERQSLADDVGEIYHCAAAVNWVLPYAGLREANVLGTRELLRLACSGQPKPFHFVSTISTCYATGCSHAVSEQHDMLPYLDSIHLGYAQSKCVAESLVRQASARGLRTTIHRPTLITGDGSTGVSNSEDLLSTMIRGCIQMGAAPDLNWLLDCCPVDYVADAIVGLSSRTSNQLDAFHLVNNERSHWRELVLWMKLYGYPLELIPYRQWLARLRTAAAMPQHPLYRLRSFFMTRPEGASGMTLPELYEDHRHPPVLHSQTQRAMESLSISCPALDSKLLDRYFKSFIDRKVLPDVDRSSVQREPNCSPLDDDFFQTILRQHYDDPTIQVQEQSFSDSNSSESITTELASWQHGSNTGLWMYELSLVRDNQPVPEPLEVFVKSKPADHVTLDVATRVAEMADRDVGKTFERHSHHLGIKDCHRREIHIYRQTDPRFRRHLPNVYAAIENADRRQWMLVLESLSGLELLDSANNTSDWTREHIDAAIAGISQIHAIWYRRESEFSAFDWLGPRKTAIEMIEMQDLWESLTNFSWIYFSEWIDAEAKPIIAEIVASVGQWSADIDRMPQTVIHNDFNPRNMAFRNTDGERRLCAYDWELAAPGIPQHDLAELLCFVLPADCSSDTIMEMVERHRQELMNATGDDIDKEIWLHGFKLSLRDLIINRIPMYCLMHRFRKQPFLARVVKNWFQLYETMDLAETRLAPLGTAN